MAALFINMILGENRGGGKEENGQRFRQYFAVFQNGRRG
jgi:hypothetical protein